MLQKKSKYLENIKKLDNSFGRDLTHNGKGLSQDAVIWVQALEMK